MGQGSSKKDNVGAHLREQARFVKRMQEYLKRLDKLFAEWEKVHRGLTRASDSFFVSGCQYRDSIVAITHQMQIFEKARADLHPQIVAVGRTAEELLRKAKNLEKLVDDRDKLSRKVTTQSQRLEKLKTKNSMRPDPKTENDIQKVEERLNNAISQYKLKELETQFETNNAMNTKYLDAMTLVSRSVLIAIKFLRLTTPEMLKAEAVLSAAATSSFPCGPIPVASDSAPQSETRLSPARALTTAQSSPAQVGPGPGVGAEWGSRGQSAGSQGNVLSGSSYAHTRAAEPPSGAPERAASGPNYPENASSPPESKNPFEGEVYEAEA
ncbi:hypothetical protein BESB_043110 [Besnoitia besnoiti]|uniref:BAR domain-containing protein n=1 Tax=Besnoitia besnoiti TaxID=94643 RepID=A0A2A9ME14_BESBE|nr:hypothetical protein BESB_043110 [Besnoitia besnoiti]PFH36119.1 hypothetical protein BESB_043110 [Besnoitia besnoiti]